MHPDESLRPGINPHIYLHCVANLPPNTAKYRMLYRLPDKTLRLYRRGDACDPGRQTGRTTPRAKDLPKAHRPLLTWYFDELDKQPIEMEDPILGLVGLGKQAWGELGGGEAILDWLRSDDPRARAPWDGSEQPHTEPVWEPDATATFWDNVRELRKRGMLPRKWRVSDLRPFLEDIYSPNTIKTVPANSSISADGGKAGDYVKRGRKPEAVRLGSGLYQLVDDPERQVA